MPRTLEPDTGDRLRSEQPEFPDHVFVGWKKTGETITALQYAGRLGQYARDAERGPFRDYCERWAREWSAAVKCKRPVQAIKDVLRRQPDQWDPDELEAAT